MAIKTIGRIVLYEPLNQDKIDELLASSDTIIFEIERRYVLGNVPDLLGAVLPTQFDDLSIDYIEALKNTIDISTFIHEENAIMFNVKYNPGTKTFDLTESYVRTEKDTTATMGTVTTGQLLDAVFITPGLNGSIKTKISLPFGQAISDPDVDILTDLGLVLDTGHTGSLFTFSEQKVPYMVFFSQPSSVLTEKYSIEFNYQNQTIEI